MIIDWYTIIFQIINFLVLVFLLRHFLYGPIIKAMDEREEKIVEREVQAEAKTGQAEEATLEYNRKKDELKRREEEIMEQARAEAEKEKHGLLGAARREVDRSRQRWEEDLNRERETFVGELRRRVAGQACAIARRCLKDLAAADLEALAWAVFMRRLQELPAEGRSDLRRGLAEAGRGPLLRGAFEIPDQRLDELKKALEELFPGLDARPEPEAVTDRGLVCGFELETGGYRLAWSVDSYLSDIEKQILAGLKDQGSGTVGGEVAGDERG